MGLAKKPLTVKEVYHLIVQEGFYEFHADSPEHVVRSQIRRHCDGLDFPSASPTKLFRLVGENRYEKIESSAVPSVVKKAETGSSRFDLIRIAGSPLQLC